MPHRGVRLPAFPILDAAGLQPVPQELRGSSFPPALHTLLGLYVSVSGTLPEGGQSALTQFFRYIAVIVGFIAALILRVQKVFSMVAI